MAINPPTTVQEMQHNCQVSLRSWPDENALTIFKKMTFGLANRPALTSCAGTKQKSYLSAICNCRTSSRKSRRLVTLILTLSECREWVKNYERCNPRFIRSVNGWFNINDVEKHNSVRVRFIVWPWGGEATQYTYWRGKYKWAFCAEKKKQGERVPEKAIIS